MKKLIFLAILIIFFVFLYQNNLNIPFVNNYVAVTNSNYSFNGNIYIGSQEYLDGLVNISGNDILILDQRYLKNPNIRIYNSYLIDDANTIEYVLRYLIEYEKENPSNWNRSLDSMRKEWIIHNLAYKVNYNRNRSKHLDLDNNDEERYNNM